MHRNHCHCIMPDILFRQRFKSKVLLLILQIVQSTQTCEYFEYFVVFAHLMAPLQNIYIGIFSKLQSQIFVALMCNFIRQLNLPNDKFRHIWIDYTCCQCECSYSKCYSIFEISYFNEIKAALQRAYAFKCCVNF